MSDGKKTCHGFHLTRLDNRVKPESHQDILRVPRLDVRAHFGLRCVRPFPGDEQPFHSVLQQTADAHKSPLVSPHRCTPLTI